MFAMFAVRTTTFTPGLSNVRSRVNIANIGNRER